MNKIDWTDEDQKALEKLQKKKKLWERKKNMIYVAGQLFDLGRFLMEQSENEYTVLGISLDIDYYPEDRNTVFTIAIPNTINGEN